jgi:F-type H+-transporting ATPase subunit epsilon
MRLSVTTPRGALVDTEVDEVTAPGELGEFGVLPGHVPLMSALKPGVIWYKGQGQAGDRSGVLAVGQGFLQVAPLPQGGDGHGGTRDRVLVLVDQALTAGDVDRAAAEKDLAAADRELAAWTGELDGAHHALVVRRGWAQARLDAAARLAPH